MNIALYSHYNNYLIFAVYIKDIKAMNFIIIQPDSAKAVSMLLYPDGYCSLVSNKPIYAGYDLGVASALIEINL